VTFRFAAIVSPHRRTVIAMSACVAGRRKLTVDSRPKQHGYRGSADAEEVQSRDTDRLPRGSAKK
jgi:hypothetical protein